MELRQVLDRLAAVAARVLAADAAAVLLPEAAKDRLTVAAAFTREGLPDLQAPAKSGDIPPPGYASALCADLPSGRLCVYTVAPRRFDRLEKDQLQGIAELGGVAIAAAQALADLQGVDVAKTRFVTVATHELRSPITVAQSLVRTVLKGYAGPLTPQQRDIFERVAGRLDFLESLVNDLLDLAATRAPELAEEEGPVALNASVGRAVLLLQPRAEEKGVNLVVQPCAEEVAVWATEDGMDRIFTNLIGNGVKYTPAGGSVTVSLGCAGDRAWVKVADTGIGIPKDALPHLFEEFYRAPNARQFAVGTGLGLAIVKELVERYGGTIEVESQVGEGTTFTVTFPRWQPTA